ncbi:MAG: hypothetical protein ACYDDV_09595 [Methanoregula sp.]
MEKMKAWSALGGTTPAEKLGALGIFEDRTLDVRFLDEIARTYGVTVTLFFEEDLARTRTLESVQQEFAHVPEFERPYIAVGSFLKFTRENDPSFEQTMREFPLMIEIVTVGETCSKEGKTVPYVAGLMPFLDEMDVEGPPPN